MMTITECSPLHPDLGLLMARHHAFCHADTPPESIHMMDPAALAAPGIRFFALSQGGTPAAMGAIKRLDAAHAELKSMHVLSEYRGRGLAQAMLDHLITTARADRFDRISLETGAQPSFAAAARLYETAGFAPCPPFGTYRADPNSLFLTLQL